MKATIILCQLVAAVAAFSPVFPCSHGSRYISCVPANAWSGEVASNTPDGRINGCSIQNNGNSETEWIIQIDGVEADLGRFSAEIYKKVISDAKRERFQGFRPGTIPPHLEPTYRAFSMDECARETILEAMQQNNIRPFENARAEFEFETFCIPPAQKKKAKKKKRKKGGAAVDAVKPNNIDAVESWRTFDTMKEAISAGWKPGQSFSFIAKNVKGQKVKGDSEVEGATPLGINF